MDRVPDERAVIASGCESLGLDVNAAQLAQLVAYLDMVRKWNQTMNLVSRRDIHRLAQRHLLDSLTGARHLAGNSVLDIGSGAGFPGVPLAIVSPAIVSPANVSPAIVAPQRSFCLCERMSRRARFLAQVQRTLGLQNVTVVDQDVNTLSETFDTVVARAVATAAELWAMVQGRLSEEGQLLVYAQVRYDEGKNKEGEDKKARDKDPLDEEAQVQDTAEAKVSLEAAPVPEIPGARVSEIIEPLSEPSGLRIGESILYKITRDL